ncbi:DUF4276 family protein [Acidithiobacillus acidisediminis]|uniref:DUF4276 family protein n=1 Tax=Acidithiobacillus acidisediminis TaxID=2937799 RepID=UPI003D6689C9
MRIEFLVEEQSAEEALKHLLPRLIDGRAQWKLINLSSKYKLLKVLPQRLAAYRRCIDQSEDLRIVVLVDRDLDDCIALKRQMEDTAKSVGLSTKSVPGPDGRFLVVNRIVIEELESWFIGDPVALRKAFTGLPSMDPTKGIFRNPDNGGSWEALHRFLKRHGIYKSSYPKIDAARRIAPHLGLQSNRSRSFQVFLDGVESLLTQPASPSTSSCLPERSQKGSTPATSKKEG